MSTVPSHDHRPPPTLPDYYHQPTFLPAARMAGTACRGLLNRPLAALPRGRTSPPPAIPAPIPTLPPYARTIEFVEIYDEAGMKKVIQKGVFVILPRPNREVTTELENLREFLAEKICAALEFQKFMIFWVPIQVRYTQPTKLIELEFRAQVKTGIDWR